jgi:transposase
MRWSPPPPRVRYARDVNSGLETIMQDVTLVGIDLGKHSFHLHGQDGRGKVVFRKRLGRKQLIEFFATFHSCMVVMEACAGSHHMARKLASFGHQVKLISPQFVRPFVKSNKNAFVDAEAMARQLADDDLGQRLLSIPGVGPITASVLAAEMGDGKQFSCGRDFAASVGLVPRQYSTGGRTNLLGISRRGDKNIRRLLVLCARAYMRQVDKRTGRLAEWVRAMLTRRHSNVVACALANKLARTAWAITTHHSVFDVGLAGSST